MTKMKVYKKGEKKLGSNEKDINLNDNLNLAERTLIEECIIQSKENQEVKSIEQFDELINKENTKIKKNNKKYTIKPRNRKMLVISNIADLIINKYSILCINEELYVYIEEDGYFKKLTKHKEKVFIRYCLNENEIEYTRSNDIEDIIYSVKTDPRIQMHASDIKRNVNLVNTKSGVYNIKNHILVEHSEKYQFFNVINARYDKDKYYKNFNNSRFNEFLNDITQCDEELKQRLKEVVGYCLSRGNQLRQFYTLVGQGSNGKSVFLNLISDLIGDENISNVQLNQLDDQRYIASLFGKMLNVGSELSDLKINDTSAIKSLVNDTDKVICRPLYKQPFSFTNYCKLLFSTNNLPELNSKHYKNNSAFFDRAVILPFNNIIPIEKQDRNLINKLKKEKDIVLNWAIEGLEQVKDNGWKLSSCKISEQYSNKYRNSQSYIERFISENLVFDKEESVFKSDIKDLLSKFLFEEDIQADLKKSMKYLNDLIVGKNEITYKKIRIGEEVRYGYTGIKIK